MSHELNAMMRRAVDGGIFPGAVLLVARREEILFFQAYGVADLFSGRATSKETIFDLASLTKPLATALAVLLLVRDKLLDLDQPVGDVLTAFRGTEKASVTVADLLDHSSGLPAWRPYFVKLRRMSQGEKKDRLQQLLAAEPLQAEPGAQTVYSDLGYMILYRVIEAAAGTVPEKFVQDRIYRPLGLKDLFFPMFLHDRPRTDFAATELCPWRGRLLCGQVHDDNAWSLGGASGHAGLFGTAQAVHRLLAEIEMGFGRGSDFFPRDLLQRFSVPRRTGGRPLGFDHPSGENPSAGRRFPPQSLGHLGFTGTSFWMVPDSGVHVVLLTNRVHPCRYNIRIRAFRPMLHDAVAAHLMR